MRRLHPLLAVGLILAACAAVIPRAEAQKTLPLRAAGRLGSASNPVTSYVLYAANLKAGDVLQVRFRGLSHLQLRVYDRTSGKQIFDRNGNPVQAQYNGPFAPGLPAYFTWNTLWLIMPVNAPDAIVVIKNPETASPLIPFLLSARPMLIFEQSPTATLQRPTLTRDTTTGTIKMQYLLSNTSSVLPIPVTLAFLYDASHYPKERLIPLSTTGQSVGFLAPNGNSPLMQFPFPATVTRVGLQISSKVYGETLRSRLQTFDIP